MDFVVVKSPDDRVEMLSVPDNLPIASWVDNKTSHVSFLFSIDAMYNDGPNDYCYQLSTFNPSVSFCLHPRTHARTHARLHPSSPARPPVRPPARPPARPPVRPSVRPPARLSILNLIYGLNYTFHNIKANIPYVFFTNQQSCVNLSKGNMHAYITTTFAAKSSNCNSIYLAKELKQYGSLLHWQNNVAQRKFRFHTQHICTGQSENKHFQNGLHCLNCASYDALSAWTYLFPDHHHQRVC